MRKHVRVVTPITTKGFRRLDDLKALEGPELEISHVEIDRGPASIEGELDSGRSGHCRQDHRGRA
jgi:allantoin racemase